MLLLGKNKVKKKIKEYILPICQIWELDNIRIHEIKLKCEYPLLRAVDCVCVPQLQFMANP